MAQLMVISWRDIPAQVVAREGRVSAKRELSARFQAAIDRAAMHSGAKGEDAYLAAWKRGPAVDCGADLDAVVEAAAAALEAEYDDDRLARLVQANGYGG